MGIGNDFVSAHAKLSRPALVFVRTVSAGLLVCAFLVVASTPVLAQDIQALLDRIERLERDIRTLNVQIARGESSATTLSSGGSEATTAGVAELTGPAIARFDARMTSLENDVRLATGSMEEMDHRIRVIEGHLEKLVSDFEFRLSELEQGRSPSFAQGVNTDQGQGVVMNQSLSNVPSTVPVTQDVGQASSGVLGTITETELQQISPESQTNITSTDSSSAAGTTGAVQSASSVQNVTPGINTGSSVDTMQSETVQSAALSPKEQYTSAFGLLRQAKYDDAAIALQTFIDQNPDDKLTPNARYWLGETYYVRSEYVRAAEVFFEGYRLAPTASKAPDTLLKLGMALGNLNKKVEACAAFTKLADEFPNASANVRTALERERLRNGC